MNQALQIDAKDGRRFALLRDTADGIAIELWQQATIRKPSKLIGRMMRDKAFHVVCNEVHDSINNLEGAA